MVAALSFLAVALASHGKLSAFKEYFTLDSVEYGVGVERPTLVDDGQRRLTESVPFYQSWTR